MVVAVIPILAVEDMVGVVVADSEVASVAVEDMVGVVVADMEIEIESDRDSDSLRQIPSHVK